MLKKQERLSKSEFDRSFAVGKRLHTSELQLIYHPSDQFQAAVVVGKKVAKRAVERNRLRRQLYEILRRFQQESPLPGTVIVVAKPALAHIPARELEVTLQSALASLSW